MDNFFHILFLYLNNYRTCCSCLYINNRNYKPISSIFLLFSNFPLNYHNDNKKLSKISSQEENSKEL